MSRHEWVEKGDTSLYVDSETKEVHAVVESDNGVKWCRVFLYWNGGESTRRFLDKASAKAWVTCWYSRPISAK